MKTKEPIARELLALLCCPETRQPLAFAPMDLLDKLEAQRTSGALRNRGGQPFDGPIVAGLVRADGVLFFPVRAGIPMLIAEEAVRL
jgi:uncharacterized protein YbaR (Trm112 family)